MQLVKHFYTVRSSPQSQNNKDFINPIHKLEHIKEIKDE